MRAATIAGMAATRARGWLWLVWGLLVFGAMNVYGPPLYPYGSPFTPLPGPVVSSAIPSDDASRRLHGIDALLYYLRDDGGAAIYFSYARAILGESYDAHYVVLTEEGGAGQPTSAQGMVSPIRPLRPWRDFQVEYPPGMLIAALAPALFASDESAYLLLFSLEMEALLTAAALLAVKTADRLEPMAGRRALIQCILLTAALGVVAVRRYDPCVAVAIAAAVYGLAARRPALAGVSLALGVALKGAPILLAPILALWFATRRDWKGLALGAASGAAALVVTGGAYAAIAGPHALDAFAYHLGRPLEIETVYSGVLILAKTFFPGLLSVEFSYGSYNAVSAAEPFLSRAAAVLQIAGVLAAYAFAWRRMRAAGDDRERLLGAVVASCLCLTAFISLGKVFSPQYMTWLIPLGAIAGAFSNADARWRLVLTMAFTQIEYPFLLVRSSAAFFGPVGGAVIVARNYLIWRWVAKISQAFAR